MSITNDKQMFDLKKIADRKIGQVNTVVSLRLECGTCRSSKTVSIEGDELYCKIHKENRNKFCINWNPSRFSIKAYLSD